MCGVDALREKYRLLQPVLDERSRRLWAASEARVLGRGGISRVAEATGMSRGTVRAGLRELHQDTAVSGDDDEPPPLKRQRLRQPGGGRKRIVERDPSLVPVLERHLDPSTRGDPESPLLWTCKSAAQLASSLTAAGHPVSERTVNRLLHELGYSLQANRKTIEGRQHPDRDAQFQQINRRVRAFQRLGQPVVSVDTKKKELVGTYRNGGREWHPKGQPERVQVHDFPDPDLGRAIPYGVYDITANAGWVSVGTDHDTATFAVEALRRWWRNMGQPLYPDASRLLVTADGGGSNSSRNRLWKYELQNLADELGLAISVCHFPPGTSKWNKIEHRMFCHITHNWRGRPLISYQVIVELIAATTTKSGLTLKSDIDDNTYPLGVKVTDKQLEELAIHRHKFHGDWNYTLMPRS